MRRYTIYGLDVDSVLALSCPPAAGPAAARISLSDGPRRQPAGPGFLRARGASAELFWPGVGSFNIQDGARIAVNPAPSVDPVALSLFLSGPAMGVLFHQRGELVLHASCCLIGEGAVLMLGATGAGKSTVAAALLERGHRLLADDVTVVSAGTGSGPDGLSVFPGPAQFKLPAPLARRWAEGSGFEPAGAAGGKRLFHLRKPLTGGPFPVRALFVLNRRGGRPQPLGSHQLFLELIKNSYCARLFQAWELARHFDQCGLLAKNIPAFKLTVNRRSDPGLLAGAIEQCLSTL